MKDKKHDVPEGWPDDVWTQLAIDAAVRESELLSSGSRLEDGEGDGDADSHASPSP